jgi:hypothetical protein
VRQNTVTWQWWMNGKNNVTSYTKCSLPESIVQILIQPLLFVFIEMLDKLITYIVCWYKTLYQDLPVAWTNCITKIVTRSDNGSHNRLDLIQSCIPTHSVCNEYVSSEIFVMFLLVWKMWPDVVSNN